MQQPQRIKIFWRGTKNKGKTKPANCEIVARPSKGLNPFKTGVDKKSDSHETQRAKHAAAVALFEQWLVETDDGRALEAWARRELRGKDLACYCEADLPCHADTLLRIANQ